MTQSFSDGISQKNARALLFLFFSLFFLSVTFFVLADDSTSGLSIFEDSDQDGLSNEEEALYGTDPLNKDTDGDGYSDGVEVKSGYDPLKPAPGDKLIQNNEADTRVAFSGQTENLTAQMSTEIVNMVQDGAGEEVTIEVVSEAMQKVVDQANEEIVLPEVNIEEIKTKTVSSKLKKEEREEQEREDIVEYLTVLSYIFASNSPKSFRTESDFESVMAAVGIETVTAMATGNTRSLEEFSKRSEKILYELGDVSVPETMLDVHVKATKMAKYSMSLKDESIVRGTMDPMGQIASLSKVQGFLGVVSDFSQELYEKLDEYGIETIPIDP